MAGSLIMKSVVELSSGRVSGRRIGGCWHFAGIPYAAAPTGYRRWRAPEPPAPWAGVRLAESPGPIAPQPAPLPGAAVPGDPTFQGEDCLNLNVWTTGLDGGRRPVMVWIHGGGFTSGTGASVLYEGTRMAERGDVVVVTFNYRLGVLGFGAHPALAGDEDHGLGNYGLLDQLAALRWVQDHITGFGGDPGNVTVFGESAGGMSVSALLGAPAARGLFGRAIIQSGPPHVHSIDRAVEAVDELARQVGLSVVTREGFDQVPVDDLVGAQQAMQASTPRPGELPLPFLPTTDGTLLPRHPQETVAAGEVRDIDVIIGTNRDEMAFFAIGNPIFRNIDDAHLERWIGRSAPACDPAAVVQAYRSVRTARGQGVTPWDLWVAIGSDIVFRAPSALLAGAQGRAGGDVRVYLFTWSTPVFGGFLGACHALEIPFVFGVHHRPGVAPFVGGQLPGADELSVALQDAWLGFARGSDPSSGPAGFWPQWDPDQQLTMVFDDRSEVEKAPGAEELQVWAAPTGGR